MTAGGDLARASCPWVDSYWWIVAGTPVRGARVASYSGVGGANAWVVRPSKRPTL